MSENNTDQKEKHEASYQYQNHPYAWIHWDGSNILMDLHCYCGVRSSVRGNAAYQVQCPSCHACYLCGQNIKLTPVSDRVDHLPEPVIGEMD